MTHDKELKKYLRSYHMYQKNKILVIINFLNNGRERKRRKEGIN